MGECALKRIFESGRVAFEFAAWLTAFAFTLPAVTDTDACQCKATLRGGWEMVAGADTIVVARFLRELPDGNDADLRAPSDHWAEAEVAEAMKGSLKIGTQFAVHAAIGDAEEVDREHGFRFASTACGRWRFEPGSAEHPTRHLLFLSARTDGPLMRPRSSLPPELPVLQRVADCQQPNAEPITGTDDPWYRFVRMAVEAQAKSPPMPSLTFFESLTSDSSWLIRYEGYKRHPRRDFRARGLLDADSRVRVMTARLLYGEMLDALDESVPIFHNAYGRDAQRGDMVPLSEIAASRFENTYRGRAAPRVERMIADPWGQPFRLRGCDTRWKHPCEFVSIGPDGLVGTRDDFSSREFPDDEQSSSAYVW